MRLLSFAAACLIRAVAVTLRTEYSLDEEYITLVDEGEPMLLAFQHGRLFLFIYSFRDRGIAVNTDVSWAGRLIARILTGFGYFAAPGSRARGGAKALIDMRNQITSGRTVGVATDGPRGPRAKSKPGILALAKATGCPVIPMATSARPAWVISRTWDRFMIPVPFARCAIVLGRPIYPSAVGEELSLDLLDRSLEAMTARADRMVGRA